VIFDAGGEADATSAAAGEAPPPWPTNVRGRALGVFGLRRERDPSDRSFRPAGYYRGIRDGITLIDYGRPGDSSESQRTLAHEFVHAYQDQQFGISSSFGFGASSDSGLMMRCLIEGEARVYEMLASGLVTGAAPEAASMREAFASDLARAQMIVATEGSPEDDLPLISYGLGGSYLLRVWLEGGSPALRAQFDAPPVTSVRWMRDIADRSDARWESSGRNLACATAHAPDGYRLFSTDSLGALRLFAFLSTALESDGEPPIQQSWDRALDWQRDSFEMFVGLNQQVAASWRIRLTDADVARDLARELDGVFPQIVVHQEDAEIELRAAESEEDLAAWSDFEPCTSAF
jgi:hypothetical protein